MNADGTDKHQLHPEETTSDYNPDWSPDGSKIAFVRDPDLDVELGRGASKIRRMRADGSSPTKITKTAASDSSPDWLPQGAGIPLTGGNGVDTGTGQGNGAGVGTAGNATTSNRQLLNTGGAAILAPATGLLLISGAVARLVVRRR